MPVYNCTRVAPLTILLKTPSAESTPPTPIIKIFFPTNLKNLLINSLEIFSSGFPDKPPFSNLFILDMFSLFLSVVFETITI